MTKNHGSNIQHDKAKKSKKGEQSKDSQETQTTTTQRASVCHRLIPKIKKTVTGHTLIPLGDTLRERWYIKTTLDTEKPVREYFSGSQILTKLLRQSNTITTIQLTGGSYVSCHFGQYYTPIGMIGHGGYGEIYYAIDVRNQEEVAVKVEPRKRKGRTVKRMILEQKVMLRLQGRPHIPKMIASGHDNRINFIVMQLLSVNVGDLKKASPVRRLGKSSVGRILQQAIAGLRDIHLGGYIHRDVKPANMCFGLTAQTRHVLIIVDFGLTRRYKNLDGTLRPFRPRAGFRGTVRYVSIRVHDRIEQGPADDLVSLVYSGLELLVGELPWKYIVKGDEVKRAKVDLQYGDPQTSFLALTNDSFQEFARAVFSINTEEEPNYAALQALLTDLVGDRRMSDPYDWEINYREAIEGVRVYPYGFQQKCRSRHRCTAVMEEAY